MFIYEVCYVYILRVLFELFLSVKLLSNDIKIFDIGKLVVFLIWKYCIEKGLVGVNIDINDGWIIFVFFGEFFFWKILLWLLYYFFVLLIGYYLILFFNVVSFIIWISFLVVN